MLNAAMAIVIQSAIISMATVQFNGGLVCEFAFCLRLVIKSCGMKLTNGAIPAGTKITSSNHYLT